MLHALHKCESKEGVPVQTPFTGAREDDFNVLHAMSKMFFKLEKKNTYTPSCTFCETRSLIWLSEWAYSWTKFPQETSHKCQLDFLQRIRWDERKIQVKFTWNSVANSTAGSYIADRKETWSDSRTNFFFLASPCIIPCSLTQSSSTCKLWGN